MRNFLVLIILSCNILVFIGCTTQPKGFTYYFNGNNTGLDTLININGYYIGKEGEDSTDYTIFMFYPNGLIRCARISSETPDDKILSSFEGDVQEFYRKVPWGVYKIDQNRHIFAQYINDLGQAGCSTLLKKYRIITKTEIEIVEHYYYDDENNNFIKISTPSSKAYFHPLSKKRDFRKCPYLKKRWFKQVSK